MSLEEHADPAGDQVRWAEEAFANGDDGPAAASALIAIAHELRTANLIALVHGGYGEPGLSDLIRKRLGRLPSAPDVHE